MLSSLLRRSVAPLKRVNLQSVRRFASDATKEEKKAHKQMVKEQKREKRKTKIPKNVKKRAMKQAKMRK